jgi:hypothetical protein
MRRGFVDTEILQAALVGLEHQRSEIDVKTAEIRRRLRSVPASNSAAAPAARRTISAAARRRMAAGQRRRWAAAKQEKPAAQKPKRVLSAAARKRIAESTRKRWAALRKATGGKLQRLVKMPTKAHIAKKTRTVSSKTAVRKAAATA